MFTVFLVIQVLLTVALVGFILVQRSDSDGLSGLGGGGGGSSSFMSGRATANFLTRTTGILAALFMLNSLWLAALSARSHDKSSLADRIEANGSLSVPVDGDVDASGGKDVKNPGTAPEAAPAAEVKGPEQPKGSEPSSAVPTPE